MKGLCSLLSLFIVRGLLADPSSDNTSIYIHIRNVEVEMAEVGYKFNSQRALTSILQLKSKTCLGVRVARKPFKPSNRVPGIPPVASLKLIFSCDVVDYL